MKLAASKLANQQMAGKGRHSVVAGGTRPSSGAGAKAIAARNRARQRAAIHAGVARLATGTATINWRPWLATVRIRLAGHKSGVAQGIIPPLEKDLLPGLKTIRSGGRRVGGWVSRPERMEGRSNKTRMLSRAAFQGMALAAMR